jgi:hypothetical protein
VSEEVRREQGEGREGARLENYVKEAGGGENPSQGDLEERLEWCAGKVDRIVAAMREREPLISIEDLRKYAERYFIELAISGKDVRIWQAVEQAAVSREKFEENVREQRAVREREARLQAGEGVITPELFEKFERELRLL